MGKKRLLILAGAVVFATSCATSLTSSSPSGAGDVDNFTVTFDFNGGTYKVGDEDPVPTFSVTNVPYSTFFYYVRDNMLTGAVTPPAHYTQNGYSLNKDGTGRIKDKYIITSDITVYAQWQTKDEHAAVSWYDNNVGDVEQATLIKTDTVFKGDSPVPLTDADIPYHSGRQFVKWTDENGDDAKFDPIADKETERAYYAKYDNIGQTHTVTLDYNDGTGTIATQTVIHGNPAVEPAIKYEGHEIDHWEKEDKSKFTFDTPIEADIKVIAMWKTVATTCTVTFNTMGGIPDAQAKLIITPAIGATIPESDKPKITKAPSDEYDTTPTWCTDQACTKEFKFGDGGDKVEGNMILYAKYSPRAADAFETDPWPVFLNEIKGKTIPELHQTEDDPYYSDWSGQHGYLGKTRKIMIGDEAGGSKEFTAVVVDEDQEAAADAAKFTFMIIGAVADPVLYGSSSSYLNSTVRELAKSTCAYLPDELRDAIKITPQHSFDPFTCVADPIDFVTIPDKLYVPSLKQITNTELAGGLGEDEQFKIFTQDHKAALGDTKLGDIWLRTPGAIAQAYNVWSYSDAAAEPATTNNPVFDPDKKPTELPQYSLCFAFAL